MKRSLLYQPLYFLFWVIYFVAARAVFLLYHSTATQALSQEDLLTIFLKGIRLDLSFSSYVSAIPFLAILCTALFPGLRVRGFIRYYTYSLLAFLSILMAIDLELYTFWGFRLDSTPLMYLSTPNEMIASAAAAPVFLLTIIALSISLVFALIFRLTFDYRNYHLSFSKTKYAGLALFFAALLVLPMRGGWQNLPINQSVVYFSENPFANHAGLNMPWNLMHAMIKYNKEARNPYQYMAQETAEEKVRELYATSNDSVPSILSVARPNVVFIILESFTAKNVGSLGGAAGVTPNLDKLAAEGISFTKAYANGDRSEKGLAALLSGYPVQTTTSILKNPKKTAMLPQLSTAFKQSGYNTGFYYGGETEFANLRSYLLEGDYDHIIDKYEFPADQQIGSWGVHDEWLFDRVLTDLKTTEAPFFTTVYTLSSHEPFDIPRPGKFTGDDATVKFMNSMNYTDWALGRFIEEAKQQSWWDSTLVVVVADHGHGLPYLDPVHKSTRFRIPLIMAGGALKVKGKQVHTLANQTDVATTLLYQAGIPHEEFKWSRNLFASAPNPFAFYVFNDGFGYITPGKVVTFDNVKGKPIIKGKGVTAQEIEYGKALMQVTFEDFTRK